MELIEAWVFFLFTLAMVEYLELHYFVSAMGDNLFYLLIYRHPFLLDP